MVTIYSQVLRSHFQHALHPPYLQFLDVKKYSSIISYLQVCQLNMIKGEACSKDQRCEGGT